MFYTKSVVLSAMNVDLDEKSFFLKRRKINGEELCNVQVWKFILLQFSGLEAFFFVCEQCSDSQLVRVIELTKVDCSMFHTPLRALYQYA